MKTDRQLALEWWKTVPISDKYDYVHLHNILGVPRLISSLTGREIEQIWKATKNN